MDVMTFIEVDYSPLKGVITNAVLGDLDLNFQSETFETLTSRKRREIA